MSDTEIERDDVAYGRKVLEVEIAAIRDMIPLLDERFERAVGMLLGCKGRVVVTGVGKSGLIGQKISATLASTGTPSLFLHSAEAVHGDMGRVLAEDVVLALSYSGATSEVVRLVPIIKKIGAKVVVLTRDADTPLARVADVCLEVGNIAEACPIGLAPTSSTTAMLALGDALAMTVAERKQFDREAFGLFHRGGSIGRQLVTVGELMQTGQDVTSVPPGTTVRDALATLCSAPRRRSGVVLVTSADGRLEGLFTDGDLRRRLVEMDDALVRPIEDVMTRNPKVATPGELVADAFKRLKDHKIDELPVVDEEGHVIGLLDVQEVLEWGVAF